MLWGLKIDYDIKVLLFKVLHEYEYCLYHSPHPLKVERRLKAVWKPKLIWEVWAQVPMTLWGLFGYVLVSFWPPGVNMVLFPGPSHDLSHLPCKIVFRIQWDYFLKSKPSCSVYQTSGTQKKIDIFIIFTDIIINCGFQIFYCDCLTNVTVNWVIRL